MPSQAFFFCCCCCPRVDCVFMINEEFPLVDFNIFVLIRQDIEWPFFFFFQTNDTKHTCFSWKAVSLFLAMWLTEVLTQPRDILTPPISGSGVRGSVDGAQWACDDDDDDDDWLTGTVWGRGWLTLRLCPHQSLGGRLLWMCSCFWGGRKNVFFKFGAAPRYEPGGFTSFSGAPGFASRPRQVPDDIHRRRALPRRRKELKITDNWASRTHLYATDA